MTQLGALRQCFEEGPLNSTYAGRICAALRCFKVDAGGRGLALLRIARATGDGCVMVICRSGKPTDDAVIESLNGTQCLNAPGFMSLDEAKRKCEAWFRDHNEVRPRGAISIKTLK